MTKDELIKRVAEHALLSKQKATEVVNAVFQAIESSLKQGEAVNLIGFGTFKVSQRAARQGRNPRTGVSISIPAKTSPSFSAGKALKEAIRA